MAMTQVSVAQAMQSPHYGFKGWLLVFYIFWALSALSAVSNALSDAQAVMLGLDAGLWRTVAFAQVALMLPFLILAPMRHRLMPIVTIACLWISVALTLGLYGMNWSSVMAAMEQQMRASVAQSGGALPDGFAGAVGRYSLMIGLAVPVVAAALFTWYLLASKRINVTYRHLLPAGTATAAPRPSAMQESAPAPEKSVPETEDPPIGTPPPPSSGPTL